MRAVAAKSIQVKEDDGPALPPDTARQYSTIQRLLSDRVPNPKHVWSKNHRRATKRLRSFTTTRTLYLFNSTNPLRKFCILTAENKLFDKFILIAIIVNCVFLAIDDEPPKSSAKGQLLEVSELIFNILYSIEMTIKIIAWGLYFAGPHSYLRSWWNVLDSVVVCGGWANMIFAGAGGISALRVFRLLKPLKAISSVPGMKIQVKALLSSIPSLLNVGALFCFLLFVFGILGMQLLGGKLRFRCIDDITGEIAENTSSQVYGLCSQNSQGAQCAPGTTCKDTGVNPNANTNGFDEIGMAWLTILQCISLEGWVDVMYMIQETGGNIGYDMYFIILILVGSYFVMNLVVAIIFIRFKGFKELEEERMRERKASEFRRKSIDASSAKPKTSRRFSSMLSANALVEDSEDSESSMASRPISPSPKLARNSVILTEPPVTLVSATASKINAVFKKKKSVEEITESNTIANSRGSTSPISKASNPPSSLLDPIESEVKYKSNLVNSDIESESKGNVSISEELSPRKPVIEIPQNEDADPVNPVAPPSYSFVERKEQDPEGHIIDLDKPDPKPVLHRKRSWLQGFHHEHIKPLAMTIIHDNRFDWFIIGCIVLNSIIMALDEYPMSDTRAMALIVSNYIFTIIFAIEMILKIAGMGLPNYLSDSWNRFDGIIVAVSIIDICMPEGNSSFTALRTFRLLRVFKLLKFLHGLRELLETVISTLTDLKYFALILFLFIFIYTLIGQQMFRGKMIDESGELSRANFESFPWAFVTVFQVLTGENWNEVLYAGKRGASGETAVPYFVTCFLAGNYIILSLFMAILLGNFETIPADLEDEARSAKWRHIFKEKIINFMFKMVSPISGCGSFLKKHFVSNKVQPTPSPTKEDEKEDTLLGRKAVTSFFNVEESKDRGDSVSTIIPDHETALCCLDKDNWIRKWCIIAVRSKWFERFVMTLILFSSIMLALDEPYTDPNSSLGRFLYVADIVITILFTIEMIVKCVALGFIVHKDAYLRSGWNRIDGFIVVVSIMNLFLSGLGFIKGIRALRALRPLRMIARFENMKLVINSIFATVPALANVLLISLLFFYIFGIIGVQQFKGLYWYCVDSTATDFVVLDLDEVECVAFDGGRWQTNKFGNFDNIGSSMSLLFELATLEQWPDIMYSAIDAQGPGMKPLRDYSPVRALFFLLFLLVCSFFVLSLFVGVVVDEYHKYHEQYTIGCITESQKEWLDTVRRMLTMNTKNVLVPPTNSFRKVMFRLVTDDKFELLITIIIALNVAVMSMSYSTQPQHWEDTLDGLNKIFTYIFIVEMILKFIGLGLRQYFKDNWNRFDFFIVLCSIIVLIMESALSGSADDMAFDPTIARVLRITRIFRIIKRAESLKQLLSTLVYSLPALYNVSALVLLLLFIYAVAGMSLFGHVMEGEYLNNKANFRKFYISMITLFRMCTGESWNGLYRDCSITPENSNCTKEEGNCGSPFEAFLYFYSFFIISAMMLLNVFVAVVLKNFEEQIAAANKELTIPLDAMGEFEKLWLKFCEPDGEFMKVSRLGTFLNLLVEPLGLLAAPKFGHDLEYFIFELKIPQANGLVHYIDLGTALTLKVFGRNTSNIPKKNEFGKYLQNEMFRKFPKFKSFKKMQTENWSRLSTMQGVDVDGAADDQRVVDDEHKKSEGDLSGDQMELVQTGKSVIEGNPNGQEKGENPNQQIPGEIEEDKIPKMSVFEYRRDHYLSVAQREVVNSCVGQPNIESHLESRNLDFGDDEIHEEEREGDMDSEDHLLKQKEDPSPTSS